MVEVIKVEDCTSSIVDYDIPIHNAVIIPSGVTNGDIIETMFSDVEISPNPYSPSIDIYVGGIMMMRVDRNWYNALYKEDKE